METMINKTYVSEMRNGISRKMTMDQSTSHVSKQKSTNQSARIRISRTMHLKKKRATLQTVTNRRITPRVLIQIKIVQKRILIRNRVTQIIQPHTLKQRLRTR